MKQYITIEQWDELDNDSKISVINKLNLLSIPRRSEMELCSIGQMIEFLGDDWFFNCGYRCQDDTYANQDELCDALWEAVKYKLNK